MVLDTLQLKKDLESDFTPSQAELLVRVIQKHVVEDLVTRRDLEVAKNELNAKIDKLETGLRSEIVQAEMRLKAEIKDVRGEIKDLKVDIVRWIVGALLVNFFGVAGLMIALIKNIH